MSHGARTAAWVLAVLVTAGCATGRTDFRVIRPSPRPTPEATPTATPVPDAETRSAGRVYRVRPGDCLWNIAARELGDPWAYRRLAEVNDIVDPDLIHPGQRLRLPPAGGTIAPAAASPTATAAVVMATPMPAGPVAAEAAPEGGTATASAGRDTPVVFPHRPQRAFAPGEWLKFSVEYFGIAAGYATLAVEEGPERHGRRTYRLVATARTHPAFEWFFKVRDRIESIFDAEGLFSWQYEKHLREGSYRNDSVMIYDQVNRIVIKDEGRTRMSVDPWVQDVLSEFYYYRTLSPAPDETVTIPVVADDGKAYELLVAEEKRERITVPAGTFDCVVVVPELKFEGLFQQKGKVRIWLTDDVRRVPVLVKTEIVIGTLDIVLRDAVVVDTSAETAP